MNKIATRLATVQLTKGRFAKVDYDDLPNICKYKWSYHHQGYAFIRRDGHTEFLHRFILGLSRKDGFQIDHINGDGLDNRKSNLRFSTQSQNIANSKKKKNCSSQYKGVSFIKKRSRWWAQIKKDGKHYHTKYFNSEREAAIAYNALAYKVHGEFARLNEVK